MKALLQVCLACFVWLVVFAGAYAVGFGLNYEPPAGSVVKITDGTGHGSAVHIGNGYYLTAAHVTSGKAEMTIKTSTGEEARASILWESPDYDIALVKSDLSNLDTANLDCRELEIGESLSLRGNPLNLEFQTTWGRVSGSVVPVGPWKHVAPVDGTMAGGMSGGPAFDADGDLVGINVGAMVQRMGFAGSLVGISYIVPSSAICGLMGRAV